MAVPAGAVVALAGGANDLSRSIGSRRSLSSGSSFRELWQGQPQLLGQSAGLDEEYDDEAELRWAAIERLPTFERITKGIVLKQDMENGKMVETEIDIRKLGLQDKQQLMESILKVVEEDNDKFLRRLRERTDQVGIESPTIEVRYERLSVDRDVYVGSRALPTLFNATLNSIESLLGLIKLAPSKKRKIQILKDVSGIVKPSRMTLLLGPPGAGKTTLLMALAGKLDRQLKSSGRITYCGRELNEFVPQRTSAYISQYDLHHGEMTVRETLDFSGRCLGVGTRYGLLVELSRREKAEGIKPDPDIDAFMKLAAMAGQETSLITDYIIKILGLDICADILVGDEMRRGISGGQKKRVTTGLDSSTTFQICKFMRQMVHIMDPAPETYDLFDDIILLSDGQIVYQGPRENALEFFEYMGFKCPERKGIADFLQEVTSKKDQEQYWYRKDEPYSFIGAPEFINGFKSFHIGKSLGDELGIPFDKFKTHPAALVTEKYGISNWELFKACFAREWLLMKQNSFVYIFKTIQITIMSVIAFTVFFRTEMHPGTLEGGQKYFGALFFSLLNVMFNGMAELAMTVMGLPVFFKQRDALFYPAWAFALPIWVLRIPVSFMESAIWVVLTYYTIGFAPAPSRFFRQFLTFFGIHNMALSLFRFIAALGRTQVVANTLGTFTILVVLLLGGFIVAKDDIAPWMIWGYYVSPMMYGQNAIVMNEFLDKRWSANNTDPRFHAPTIGRVLLDTRGFFTRDYWFWICIGALLGFSLLFNILFIIALTFLNPFSDSKTVVVADDDHESKKKPSKQHGEEDLDTLPL